MSEPGAVATGSSSRFDVDRVDIAPVQTQRCASILLTRFRGQRKIHSNSEWGKRSRRKHAGRAYRFSERRHGVRTRSVATGSSRRFMLIGSLSLPVLTQRCANIDPLNPVGEANERSIGNSEWGKRSRRKHAGGVRTSQLERPTKVLWQQRVGEAVAKREARRRCAYRVP